MIDSHCLDTDLETARDFGGRRDRISLKRSVLLATIEIADNVNDVGKEISGDKLSPEISSIIMIIFYAKIIQNKTDFRRG